MHLVQTKGDARPPCTEHCVAVELSVEELVGAGLYDPAAPDAVERLRLLRVLERRGGTLELMVQADEVGRLPRLSAELLVHGAVERLTAAEVATAAGVSTERFATLWRVAGFREPDTDDRRFTTAQVELVHLIELAAGVFGDEGALQLLRVVGASASRIAEAA